MEQFKKCRLANTALILSCLALIFSVLTALPALICGIIALFKISKSNGELLGEGIAITSIVMSSLLILLTPFYLLQLSALLPFIYTLF